MKYTGANDTTGKKIHEKDDWTYRGTTYTAQWVESEQNFMFINPNESATVDDHIPIQYSAEGKVTHQSTESA